MLQAVPFVLQENISRVLACRLAYRLQEVWFLCTSQIDLKLNSQAAIVLLSVQLQLVRCYVYQELFPFLEVAFARIALSE